MKEYQVINILEGIYEECVRDNDKDYMERNTALTETVKALTEIQYYRAIGTVDECREARERRVGIKPNKADVQPYFRKHYANTYSCPLCHKKLAYHKQKFCQECGQALQWPE